MTMDTGIKVMLFFIILEALSQFHLIPISQIISEIKTPKNCLQFFHIVTCSTESKQLSILLLTLMVLSFIPSGYTIFKFARYIKDKEIISLQITRKTDLINGIEALMIKQFILVIGIMICLDNSMGFHKAAQSYLRIYVPYLIVYQLIAFHWKLCLQEFKEK